MTTTQLIHDTPTLTALAPEWEALADTCALPGMTAPWVLAWLRHVAPADVTPRVVVVRDNDTLIGVAPFYTVAGGRGRRDYRLVSVEFSNRLAPLALPGREQEVAEAIARSLASATPSPDLIALESGPPDAPWLSALREHWPGRVRPLTFTYNTKSCPNVSLAAGSFDKWFADKSSNFRSQMRRARRQFEAAGGTVRMAVPATLPADIDAFVRLHTSRWEGRGKSSLAALGERLSTMLNDVGETLLQQDGRFRLQIMEIEGRPISAQLFIAAGGQVIYFNGGWDEQFAHLKPAMLAILIAIEEAFALGDKCLDLGSGAVQYKLRFADGDDPVCWRVLMVPSPRLPLTFASMIPTFTSRWTRVTAKRVLSPKQIGRLRNLRRRLGYGNPSVDAPA
jgi:CelD/BcsL family acetyltransferase involved in cellulose biosynthesis